MNGIRVRFQDGVLYNQVRYLEDISEVASNEYDIVESPVDWVIVKHRYRIQRQEDGDHIALFVREETI